MNYIQWSGTGVWTNLTLQVSKLKHISVIRLDTIKMPFDLFTI